MSKRKSQIKNIIAMAMVAIACLGGTTRGAIVYVGALTDDSASEISNWNLTETVKSLDFDGDNIYGTAGYAWMNSSNEGALEEVFYGMVEDAPSYTDGIAYAGATNGASGSYLGAADRRNVANTADVNVGYAGPNYYETSGAANLQVLFAYTLNRDMAVDETIRIGVVLDSYNPGGIIGADSLQVVAGGDSADATVVARNGAMDMYFFDITGLTTDQTIEIWGAKAADVSEFSFNAITIGGVTFDSTLNVEMELSPSEGLDITLYDPATLAAGVVEAAFTYGVNDKNVEITAVSVIDQQHSGAFSVVGFTSPLELTSPWPATEALNVEFNVAGTGLVHSDTSTGVVEVVWNEIGGSSSYTNTVPVTALYLQTVADATTEFTAVDGDLTDPLNWTLGVPGTYQTNGVIEVDGFYTNVNQNSGLFNGATVTVSSDAVLTLENDTSVSGGSTLVVNNATLNCTDDVYADGGTIIFNEGSVSTAADRWGAIDLEARIVVNGGTHSAGSWVEAQGNDSKIGCGIDFLGGTVTAGEDFQFQVNTINSVGGSAVLRSGAHSTTFSDMSGLIDFIPGWVGSWEVAAFGPGDWETALTGGGNFKLDGDPIDATRFAANFSVSGDGTTLWGGPEGRLLLQIASADGTLDFEWNSSRLLGYTLESTPSLVITNWAVYNDGVTTYEDIPGGGTGTITLTGVPVNGAVNFFRVIEGEGNISYITVQEPSFEDPAVTAGRAHASMNATLSAAWNPSANGAYSILPDDFQPEDPQFADGATHGTHYLLMREVGTINQDLGLVAIGDEISVSFDVGRAWGQYDGGAGTETGVMTCTLSVGSSFNTVSIDTADFAIVDKGVWQTINNNWTTTAAGTLNIEFAYVSGLGPFLDNISKVERVEP